MTPWQTGVRLGPYELISPIGAGGMGEVWKARDTRLDRTVAVKRLTGRHSARFEQEARAIAALNHPNICQLYDVGPDYLVLEYVQGQPLKGPLPPDEAVRLAIQIASALEEAHGHGILHRDLKPANVMVTAKGSVKLLDFGLAKLTHDSSDRVDATKTIEGTILGTAAYMAPEQAEGKPLDARSEVFSFGAVLYEMLSGSHAFTGESTVRILSAVLRDEPGPLKAPAALERIVRRCLEKNPEDRFQTMAELKTALEQIPAKRVEQRPSIAVLPFSNMSTDKEDEYFSDGLAEEIINLLAQIPGLKVIARTSAFAFRGKEIDIRKVAEALGVATVLEGSVRRVGNRIRVTAQLITAADGSHLWSQRYDREMADVFAVQDEVAAAIAAALHVRLSGTAAPVQQYKPNLPAYEALLKARYYLGQGDPNVLPRIKESFEQAIALDPKFALPHCEYGLYFLIMANTGAMPANQAMPAIRTHAQRALELDPSIPDGHAMLGCVAGFYDYDWPEAERRFRLAMARDPVPPSVRTYYALYYLLPIGRAAEAVQQVERALQEDPLNFSARIALAVCLAGAGREEESANECRKLLELNPAAAVGYAFLSISQAAQGKLEEALPLAERSYALAPSLPLGIGLLVGLLKRTGDTRRAEELIQKLKPGDAFGAPRGLAYFHWVCGEMDAAAEWIEKAIDQRDAFMLWGLRLWFGKDLRSTPRWAVLMRKMNLPEA